MIDKIRWRGYPPYKQSVYDSEELTALELAGRTTYKMNEVIDKVNNLESNIGNGAGGVPGISDNLNSRAINVKYPPRDLKPAVGDGVTDDSDAINAISAFAKENNMAVIFPSGKYRCTKTLFFYEGVKYSGASVGTNWRAAPNQLTNTFKPELYNSDHGTVLLFTGNGSKYKTVEHITSSMQSGYYRDNPVRDLNNDMDATFKLKDFTNQDAVGNQKATLKPFSVAVEIVGNSFSRIIINDIRIVTSCPGDDEQYGTKGYGINDRVIPWARWDVGLFMQSGWRYEFNNVEVVGYWDIAGLFMTPQAEGDPDRGYAEHTIFRNCNIQSSTLIRSGDTWPILSKTDTSITVRYTPSHRFNTTGIIRVGTSFASNTEYSYTGLEYDAANATLTFTGMQSTSGIQTTGDSKHHIITTVGGGFAHTIFHDCELYDFGHSTLLDDAHPAIGREYTASLEMSGNPMRALKFYNTVLSPAGRVAIHAGKAWDTEFFSCYIEPRNYRTELGGALQTRGSVLIWGVKADMMDEVGDVTGNTGHLRMYGRTLHPSINASPTLFVNNGYRYSGIEGDYFNPRSFYYDHENQRMDTRATRLWGHRGYELDLRTRTSEGQLRQTLQGYSDSGNVGIGQTASSGHSVAIFPYEDESSIELRRHIRPNIDGGYSVGTPTFRWNNVYAVNDTIQTSDAREKIDIGDIPDEWLDAWEDVRWVRYKNIDGDRWHTGLIAQEVKEAFESRGIDPFEIGILCYDEWDDIYDYVEVPYIDEEGIAQVREEKQLVKKAGSRYAIRYDEAQAIEAAYQRREIERLKEVIQG